MAKHTMIVRMGATGIIEESRKGVVIHAWDSKTKLATLRGRMKTALGVYPSKGKAKR